MNRNLSFPSETGFGVEFRLRRAILALAPVLVTFLVQLMIWPIIRPFAWFLFGPAVFLSAWIGGRRLGILASVIATLLVWYFFLPQERSFFAERTVREVMTALSFLGMGVVFSLFHDRLKRANMRVAEALAASRYQAQLESVFQAIRDGIVVTDMKGKFLLVNEAEARINGFPSAKAMKRNITFYQDLYELSYPDGKLLSFEEWPINKVLRGESIANLELRARRRDIGREWFFSFSGEPVRDERGEQILAVVVSRDITEQKRAEESLRASKSRFKATFENAAAGIAHLAPDGRWLEVNQRLCDIIGYTREELMTKTFGAITHPDDLNADVEQARRLLAGEIENYTMEKRYYRKDGSIVWVNLTGSIVRKADGSPDYFIAVVEDISARKQAEKELRESESRFRQLAESLPQLVWTCRADGPCDYLSPQWVAYTGISEAEQLGFGWRQQLHPDDREPAMTAWNQAVASGAPLAIEVRVRRNDGAYRWFKARAVALRDSSGAVIKWFGANTDIDDQKQAEQALRESKERLAGIVSSAMDAIITVDQDQRIVLFNEAAERMFGCTVAETMGQPLNRFIPDRFRDAHTEDIRHFGENSGANRPMGKLRALSALRADGTEFPIEASISKIEIGGRKLYTVIHRDITERIQAEAEREQLAREQTARAAAEAANRSKDEFLAMVSHELRSPLNAILGYTRMLRSGPVDRDAIDKGAAIVERNAKAQLQIIEDLLDSASIITGKLRIEPVPVDLVPALEAALDTVRASAEAKGVTLLADFGSLPEETFGDSTRLQQILWNLLSNSVKFTPKGGRIELRMEGAADHIRIIVSDTGRGIEPEFLPFIFDRFRQADTSSTRRFGGLGLGLSLVKHLVELHGGTITATSEGLGRGATFTVTLPRRRPEFIPAPPPAVTPREVRTERAIALGEALSLEGMSVLVVDDQEEARVVLTRTLGEYGAQVTAVSSGVEALAFLSNLPSGKRPDALILDIAMPDEDGYTVLKKVRAWEAERGYATDQIPAIALTAFGRSEDRLRALQAGFFMHVAKPVEPAELAVVISSLTSRGAQERRRNQ